MSRRRGVTNPWADLASGHVLVSMTMRITSLGLCVCAACVPIVVCMRMCICAYVRSLRGIDVHYLYGHSELSHDPFRLHSNRLKLHSAFTQESCGTHSERFEYASGLHSDIFQESLGIQPGALCKQSEFIQKSVGAPCNDNLQSKSGGKCRKRNPSHENLRGESK